MAEDVLQWLTLIPGVTPEKARRVKEAGFRTLDALRRATTEEIAQVEGIGPILAQRIRNYLTWVEGEIPEEGLLLCPECGAFISPNATECPHCGIAFEEGEVSEEDEEEVPPAEEVPVLHMCPSCGAFISAKADVCTHCGAVFEEGEEFVAPEIPIPEEAAEATPTPCPLCGTFVAPGTGACPSCGASLVEAEEDDLDQFLAEMEALETPERPPEKKVRPPKRREAPKGIVRDFLTRWERTKEAEKPKDPEELLDNYDRLLEVDPTLERIWVKRAEVLRELGRDEEAVEALARAAELNPKKRADYKLQVMDILRTTEDVSPIAPEWETVAPAVPEQAAARALAQYERLLQVDPTLVRAWEVKAELLHLLGREEEATVALQTAVDLRRQEGERRLGEVGRLEGEEVTPPRPAVPYRRRDDGMVNGLAPGRVNGLDAGRVNGLVNGSGMGRVNGLSTPSGRVNGLINGTGLTNGRIDDFRPPIRPPDTRWLLNSIGVAGVLFAMILAPLVLNVFFEVEGGGILVDGDFADWVGVPAYVDTLQDVPANPDVDLVAYKVLQTNNKLGVYARVQGQALNGSGPAGVDAFFVMIDQDGSETTGYRLEGLGVDSMIEVSGWNSSIHRAQEHTFEDAGSQDDWNAFRAVGRASVAVRGSEMELLTVAPDTARVRVLTADIAGNADATDAIVSRLPGALTVAQRTLAPSIITSAQVPLVALDVRPHGGDVTLANLSVALTGTAPPDTLSLNLLDENSVILASVVPGGPMATFPFAMTVDRPRVLQITASFTVLNAGTSLGLRVIGAESGATVSFQDVGLTGSYILGAPDPTVDGAFADWSAVPGLFDADDDVFTLRAPGLVNENIDLRGFRMHLGGNASFYAEIDQDGRMLGGADLPSLRPRPLPPSADVDSDDDTVPDVFEPNLSFDFDNDGTPDADEGGDVDSDGVVDYPDGSDVWLNTTIPAWYPTDYRDRVVTRYVGPISRLVLEGTERWMLFVDADGLPTGLGVAAGTALHGMDYLLLVEGRHGEIRSSALYAYNSTTISPWQFLRDVDAAVDTYRLEVAVDAADLPLAPEFAVLFRAVDWMGARDDSDATLGNATAGRGTRAPATEVVLNEISSATANDWIELANPTSTSVDLTGWAIQIRPAQGGSWTTIYTFGSVTIGAWGSGSEYLSVDLGGDILPNKARKIRLVDASGLEVDQTQNKKMSAGQTWARYKDSVTGKPWDTNSDNKDWYVSDNPTQGDANDLAIPEFGEIAVPLGAVLLLVLGAWARKRRRRPATRSVAS